MMVFINKVDHEKSVCAQNICDLQDELEIVQTPVGYGFEGGSFVDLIQKNAFKTEAQKVIYLDTLPSGSEQRISTLREKLHGGFSRRKGRIHRKIRFSSALPRQG
jgi:hypothetical protein